MPLTGFLPCTLSNGRLNRYHSEQSWQAAGGNNSYIAHKNRSADDDTSCHEKHNINLFMSDQCVVQSKQPETIAENNIPPNHGLASLWMWIYFMRVCTSISSCCTGIAASANSHPPLLHNRGSMHHPSSALIGSNELVTCQWWGQAVVDFR